LLAQWLFLFPHHSASTITTTTPASTFHQNGIRSGNFSNKLMQSPPEPAGDEHHRKHESYKRSIAARFAETMLLLKSYPLAQSKMRWHFEITIHDLSSSQNLLLLLPPLHLRC
jgi:hypothetical protein